MRVDLDRVEQRLAVDALPRTANGKPDAAAVHALATPKVPAPLDGMGVEALRALYADVLGVPAGPDDTFVGLGGDSLSYVELLLRLEGALGDLPEGWHLTTLRDLAPARREPRRGKAIETGVLLRALAIVAIVGSHTELWVLLGGAHVLLGVAGFNAARFLVGGTGSPGRRILRGAARVVVPSVVVIGIAAALTERYTVTNVLLLNGFLGPERWGPTWHFWFVEVLVTLLLALGALLGNPAREAVVVGGLLALIWLRTVRIPSWAAGGTALLAAASLQIYLTHWLVHPPLEARSALLATAASLAVGCACWSLEQRVRSRLAVPRQGEP